MCRYLLGIFWVLGVVSEEQINQVSTFSALNFAAGSLSSFIVAYVVDDAYYWLYVVAILSTLVGNLVVK